MLIWDFKFQSYHLSYFVIRERQGVIVAYWNFFPDCGTDFKNIASTGRNHPDW